MHLYAQLTRLTFHKHCTIVSYIQILYTDSVQYTVDAILYLIVHMNY